MDSIRDLIDTLRAKSGSDNKSGPLIGVSGVTVSRWRTGRDFPTDENALKLAELLDLDAAYVLAVIRADRAKSDEARATWQRIAQAFATVLVTVGALGTPGQAEARFNNNPARVPSPLGANATEIHIALRRRRRTRRGGFAPHALLHAARSALGLSAPRAGAA